MPGPLYTLDQNSLRTNRYGNSTASGVVSASGDNIPPANHNNQNQRKSCIIQLCLTIAIICCEIVLEIEEKTTFGSPMVCLAFVVLHIIINGINSNLITLQCSKISDLLLDNQTPGTLAANIKIFELPWKALFTGDQYAKTPVWPLIAPILGPLPLIGVAEWIKHARLAIVLKVVVASLLVSIVHIMLMLYIAHVSIHALWKKKIKHGSLAYPSLIALSELLNSCLLAVVFGVLGTVV
ncbi:solute carrier family 41 member 2-like [Anopheles albimanus]|uniref:solute carrier family 41 member 2-like n=1 Tax=Anopheles albimanus TaxID=7167 RepID=UPI001640D02C|nr:solute carrier family 41 member 2-like [Anopheles albimanus]